MNGRFSIDWVGNVLLLAALLLLGVLPLFLSGPAGRVGNQGAAGTSDLAARLPEWGYRVRVQESWQVQTLADSHLLLVLGAATNHNPYEIRELDNWIRQGGTLIVAQNNGRASALLHQYNLDMRRLWRQPAPAELNLPTLNWPPTGAIDLRPSHRLHLSCGQAAIHIGDCDSPFLLSFGWGQGQIVVVAALHPFTNGGLRQQGNARLVQNLIQLHAPPGTVVVLDESRHGHDLLRLLARLETGTLLAALLLLLGYGLWHLRPFGQPRPTSDRTPPEERQTAAFINYMAAAHQRTDPERRICHHYWQRLKRQFGRRYGLHVRLSDDAFLAALKPLLNDDQLLATLLSLRQRMDVHHMSDANLRLWTAAVIEITASMPGSGQKGLK
ncbi:MAG: DUF4350 domain-containing protein [Chloroflexota bacterium]